MRKYVMLLFGNIDHYIWNFEAAFVLSLMDCGQGQPAWTRDDFLSRSSHNSPGTCILEEMIVSDNWPCITKV